MTSVGSILGGAFGLLRERPAAVLIWGLVYMAGTIAMTFGMLPFMQPPGTNLESDPAASWAAIQSIFGALILFMLGFLILFSVLLAAAERAVLKPHESGFAFIRLGMDEVRLSLLAILFTIFYYVVAVVLIILFSILAGILAVAAGPSAMPVMVVVIFAVMFAVMSWLMTRLSLVYPLTLLRGEFVIGESWRLTRGHFWSLFGAYFVIFLLWFLAAITVSLVSSGSYLTEMMNGGFTPEAMDAAAQRQRADQLAGISASMIISWILGALLGGAFIALFGGASATAARDLTGDTEGVAGTFA